MVKFKEIDELNKPSKVFSICTLVTNIEEYKEMLDSFAKAGFTNEQCEFIYIDNSQKNKYDAYDGLNKFLNISSGEYIILCHQDILLNFDNIDTLLKRIEEVEKLDQNWAILGNAGYKDFNNMTLRITDPAGDRTLGTFPSKVRSMDENFLVVKNEANLSLSRNIGGFHLYGTDICQIAHILGYNSYVIDFHLLHKSAGKIDKIFFDNKKRFINKYERALKTIIIRTPITKIFASNCGFLNWLCNKKFCYSIKKRYDTLIAKGK
jgi:hypothetical protein